MYEIFVLYRTYVTGDRTRTYMYDVECRACDLLSRTHNVIIKCARICMSLSQKRQLSPTYDLVSGARVQFTIS